MRILTYTNPNGNYINFSYSPYLIESIEGISSPELDIQTQKSPYQDGNTFLDALYEPRMITVSGKLNYPKNLSAIMAARQTISAVLNPKLGPGTLTLQVESGTYKISALPKISYPNININLEPFQSFYAEFTCPDPYWKSGTASGVTCGYTVAALEFPVEFVSGGIEFSTRSASIQQTAYNFGNVPCPVYIAFTGPATNPVIYNLTTGEYMKILTTIALGDQILIDTTFGNKTIYLNSSGGIVSAIQYMDLNSTFFQLEPGANILTYSDDSLSGSATAQISWSDRFISI